MVKFGVTCHFFHVGEIYSIYKDTGGGVQRLRVPLFSSTPMGVFRGGGSGLLIHFFQFYTKIGPMTRISALYPGAYAPYIDRSIRAKLIVTTQIHPLTCAERQQRTIVACTWEWCGAGHVKVAKHLRFHPYFSLYRYTYINNIALSRVSTQGSIWSG